VRHLKIHFNGSDTTIGDWIIGLLNIRTPERTYKWETKKNPFGLGYIVGFVARKNDERSNIIISGLWIVDGPKVTPIDDLGCAWTMETPGFEGLEPIGMMERENYLNLFRKG